MIIPNGKDFVSVYSAEKTQEMLSPDCDLCTSVEEHLFDPVIQGLLTDVKVAGARSCLHVHGGGPTARFVLRIGVPVPGLSDAWYCDTVIIEGARDPASRVELRRITMEQIERLKTTVLSPAP